MFARDNRNPIMRNAQMERDIVAEWLKTGMELAEVDQQSMGDAIGISQDKVSKIITGKRSMTASEMIRASMFLGRALPVKALAGDIRPLELGREDSPDDSHVIDFSDYRPAISTEGRHGLAPTDIPQIDGTIGLGSRDDVETLQITLPNGQSVAAAPVLGAWRIPQSVLQRRVRTSIDHLHFLECEGNSMYPIIRDGDVVLIDKSRTNPTMPGIFALWENGGQTIKQIEIVRNAEPLHYRLIPANKDYATYEVPADDVIIIGRYVARFTVD